MVNIEAIGPIGASNVFNQKPEHFEFNPFLETIEPIGLDEAKLTAHLLGINTFATQRPPVIFKGIPKDTALKIAKNMAQAKGILAINDLSQNGAHAVVLTRDTIVFVSNNDGINGTVLFKPRHREETREMIKIALEAGRVNVFLAATTTMMGLRNKKPLSVASIRSLQIPVTASNISVDDYLDTSNTFNVCGGIDYCGKGEGFVDRNLTVEERTFLSGLPLMETMEELRRRVIHLDVRMEGNGFDFFQGINLNDFII